jgi:hypothetical protein
MTATIGARTFRFLITVLRGAALQPVLEAVGGGLPDGVVGIPRFGGDALIELEVQIPELVDDSGLGLAADLAALPFPVAV